MIIVYQAWSIEFGEVCGLYLREVAAQEHCDYCNARLGDYDLFVQPRRVSSLPGRRVVVDGAQVGYQFAQRSMGSRTVRRTVRGLEEGENGELTGWCKWQGRKLQVSSTRYSLVWRVTGWEFLDDEKGE